MKIAHSATALVALCAVASLATPTLAQDERGYDAGYAAVPSCQASVQSGAVGGGLLGAIAGAVIGSNLAHGGGRTGGAIIGALGGAAIGSNLGRGAAHSDEVCQRADYVDTRPVYAQPVYAHPVYDPPVYAQPAYAQPIYDQDGAYQPRPAYRYDETVTYRWSDAGRDGWRGERHDRYDARFQRY